MMNYLTPKVPETCLCCGARWIGGHALPGTHMKVGLRSFYDCGASISIFRECSNPDDGAFHLLLKNCWCEHNQKVGEIQGEAARQFMQGYEWGQADGTTETAAEEAEAAGVHD